MEGRSRAEGRVTSSPSPLSTAKRGQKNDPRLYVVTLRLADTAALARAIGDVIAAGDVAAVLVRLEPSDERTLINRIKAIADAVQRRDAALLLDGHPEIVARAGADGAHLTGVPALSAALNALKPDRIAGAGGLRNRHDAMLAGEAGADYVMFGEPDPLGGRPPLDALVERLEWWAEIFQPPCVGYAASLDEVSPLTQAGADFIALGDWIWTHAQGPAAAVAAASRVAGVASRQAPPTEP
jgi:thiamine-phosphate pyrophosphorylase